MSSVLVLIVLVKNKRGTLYLHALKLVDFYFPTFNAANK